jgi:hypothetical protein
MTCMTRGSLADAMYLKPRLAGIVDVSRRAIELCVLEDVEAFRLELQLDRLGEIECHVRSLRTFSIESF